MRWDNEKEFTPKLARINTAILDAKKHGYLVSVIGESAGAPMAISAAAKHDLNQTITLCGVDNPKMYISPKTYVRAPAFKKAFGLMSTSFQTLDLLKTQTVRAFADRVVSPKDSMIVGARNHQLFSLGHFFTIGICLTLLSGYLVQLVKR